MVVFPRPVSGRSNCVYVYYGGSHATVALRCLSNRPRLLKRAERLLDRRIAHATSHTVSGERRATLSDRLSQLLIRGYRFPLNTDFCAASGETTSYHESMLKDTNNTFYLLLVKRTCAITVIELITTFKSMLTTSWNSLIHMGVLVYQPLTNNS